MRPRPPRASDGSGGIAVPAASSSILANAFMTLRSTEMPFAIKSAISRVICGAATLVPFKMAAEPLRLPDAMMRG